MPPAPRPHVVVIQALPGLGDALWHLGACRAIAAASPGGVITLASPARTQARELFAAEPWLAESFDLVRGTRGALALIRALRARRFDRAVILHHSPSIAFAIWAAGVPRRAGFGLGLQRFWLNDGAVLPARLAGAHQIARSQALLETLGIASAVVEPELALRDESRRRVAERFDALPGPWLALAIGGSEAFKRWPEERFAMLIDGLDVQVWPSIFLIGGAGDGDAGARIRAAVHRPGVIPVFDLPIAASAALIARAARLVGNDSGLMNLAVAVGTPAIGLFGATLPLWHDPNLHALTPPPGSSHAGMAAISVDAVLAALNARA